MQDHYAPTVVYGGGTHTFDRRIAIGTRYVSSPSARWSIRPTPKDVERGPCAAGCDQGEPEGRRPKLRDCRTGTLQARRRCAMRCWCSAATMPDFKRAVRHQRTGRSGATPGRSTAAARGGNPDKGRDLSQRHAREQRRHRPSTSSTSRTCRVDVRSGPSSRVQRRRATFEKNSLTPTRLNNTHGQKRRRRRRSPSSSAAATERFPNCLPEAAKGWNYNSAGSTAARRRNPERLVEVPGTAACDAEVAAVVAGLDIFASGSSSSSWWRRRGRGVLHRGLAAGAHRQDAQANWPIIRRCCCARSRSRTTSTRSRSHHMS